MIVPEAQRFNSVPQEVPVTACSACSLHVCSVFLQIPNPNRSKIRSNHVFCRYTWIHYAYRFYGSARVPECQVTPLRIEEFLERCINECFWQLKLAAEKRNPSESRIAPVAFVKPRNFVPNQCMSSGSCLLSRPTSDRPVSCNKSRGVSTKPKKRTQILMAIQLGQD